MAVCYTDVVLRYIHGENIHGAELEMQPLCMLACWLACEFAVGVRQAGCSEGMCLLLAQVQVCVDVQKVSYMFHTWTPACMRVCMCAFSGHLSSFESP